MVPQLSPRRRDVHNIICSQSSVPSPPGFEDFLLVWKHCSTFLDPSLSAGGRGQNPNFIDTSFRPVEHRKKNMTAKDATGFYAILSTHKWAIFTIFCSEHSLLNYTEIWEKRERSTVESSKNSVEKISPKLQILNIPY